VVVVVVRVVVLMRTDVFLLLQTVGLKRAAEDIPRPYTAFQAEVRLMFALMRAHHHLDYARKGARMEAVPRALARVKEYLAGVVCPASPSLSTAALLRGGASQWLRTSFQILERHYIEVIEG